MYLASQPRRAREISQLLHDTGKNKLKVFTWKTITPPFSKILPVARFTLLWRHDGHAHRTAALTSLWLPTGASTFSPRHTTVENPLGNPASSTNLTWVPLSLSMTSLVIDNLWFEPRLPLGRFDKRASNSRQKCLQIRYSEENHCFITQYCFGVKTFMFNCVPFHFVRPIDDVKLS